MKKYMKPLKIAGNVVLWLFVAFAVLVTLVVFVSLNDADGVPSIGGKCAINILTDSMSPTFESGDMIFSQKLTDAEKRNLQIGDVISFHTDLNNDGNDEINTHRIVDYVVDGEGNVLSYITKGDNPNTNVIADDAPVPCNDIIAKWSGSRLKGIGSFISFLQTSVGFLVVIVLPLVAFFVYELIKFILTVMQVKNEGKKQITAADEEIIKQKAIEEYLRRQAAAQEGGSAAGADSTDADSAGADGAATDPKDE